MSSVTRKYSISIPEDLAETVRAQVGPGGFSAYVTEALRHRLAMDRLTELVEDHEIRNGEFTEDEIARADALLGISSQQLGEGRSAA
ncbi:hypothetical protein [Streptomyces sp. SYSU K21746]